MPPSSSDRVRADLEEGLRAHQEGRLEPAREAYLRALALAPDHPEALNLLGTVCLQLGDAGQAARCLERAAQKLGNHPGVVGNLAHAYCALGRYDEARETYGKASRLDPHNPYYPMGIANCLGMQGKQGEAEQRLRELASRFPDVSLIWLNLGHALRDQRRLEEALPCYLKALEIEPRSLDARNDLGRALHGLFRLAEAEAAYRACIATDPDHLPARYNLASVVIDAGRFAEAEEICRDLIRRDPAAAQAHGFLAAALGHQGRIREALGCQRRALELAPEDARLVESHAATLAATGDLERALLCFARAFALDPDSTSAHQLLGNVLLSVGCLADGWEEYGCRPAAGRFRSLHPNVAASRTLPARLEGREVCVLREQGLGDELFFMRYAPRLKASGARITYSSSDRLCSLFRRVACVERVLDESSPLPQGSAVILAGDLPHALSTRPASKLAIPSGRGVPDPGPGAFPRCISVFWPPLPPSLLITPDAERLDAVRGRLAQAGKPPYLGLTWRGGVAPAEQREEAWLLHKEVRVEPFAHALKDFPGTLVALQRNPEPGEFATLSRTVGKPVCDFSDLNDDLESMLAALALAEEYVGVSNTNMHLRAAAGRTARVLVPCPAEWRWMASGASSPWFPGFTLYRQSLDGDWSPALARLRDDLKAAYP